VLPSILRNSGLIADRIFDIWHTFRTVYSRWGCRWLSVAAWLWDDDTLFNIASFSARHRSSFVLETAAKWRTADFTARDVPKFNIPNTCLLRSWNFVVQEWVRPIAWPGNWVGIFFVKLRLHDQTSSPSQLVQRSWSWLNKMARKASLSS